MKKIFGIVFLNLTLFLLLIGPVFAAIGVGVGTGKIYVDEELKPGIIYDLPELTVINTGDVASEYQVTTEFRETQEQLKPGKDWLSYSPDTFFLEPGESQVVKVSINVPVRTEPGDYFAFLSAHPNKKSQDGNTTIGVAAAAKLYFTVTPGSIWEGIYFRAKSLWIKNQPWTNIGAGAIVVFMIMKIVMKFVNIDISLNKKDKKPVDDTKQE